METTLILWILVIVSAVTVICFIVTIKMRRTDSDSKYIFSLLITLHSFLVGASLYVYITNFGEPVNANSLRAPFHEKEIVFVLTALPNADGNWNTIVKTDDGMTFVLVENYIPDSTYAEFSIVTVDDRQIYHLQSVREKYSTEPSTEPIDTTQSVRN
ncbi:MAG: hypothetical protein KBB88_03700 [Candidatus Pacebacteria bacterium]|nr:hypothetical protein [Candidatus Paceibacterota bacterium]